MKSFIQLRMMHKSVTKVKIGIMKNKQTHATSYKIPDTVFGDIGIYRRITCLLQENTPTPITPNREAVMIEFLTSLNIIFLPVSF